jgi:hypothetical protein
MGGAAADGGSRPATEEDQQLGSAGGQAVGRTTSESEPPEADWLDATTSGEGSDAARGTRAGRPSDDVEAQRDAIRHQE